MQNTCGYNGCKRPVKERGVRCYMHVGLSEAAAAPSIELIEALREAIADSGSGVYATIPSTVMTADEALQDSILNATPIAVDAVAPLTDAYAEIARGRDLTVPNVAAEGVEDHFRSFLTSLESNGLRGRVGVVQLRGFNRAVTVRARRRQQHLDDAYHEVAVIDPGTPQQTVVDPFISLYAPVLDQSRSVDEQLASGETPFGDAPWVGTLDEYADGAHMWWDHAEVVIPQGAGR